MNSALVLLAVAAVDLTWRAPQDDCPSQDEVLERIEASLPVETDLEIAAQVDPIGDRWRLRLETRVGESLGSRELRAPDCAALVDATILLATMAARSAPSTSSSEPSAEPEGEVAAEETSAEPSSQRPWSLGLGVRWDGGRLPSEVPGIQLDVAWSKGPWSVGGRAFGWPPSSGPSRQGTQARFIGLGAGALGCAGLPWVVRPETCLAVDLWTLRGSAEGVSDAAEPWSLQVAVAARLQATWPATSAWALRLAGELGVELNPSRFRVEPLGEVHRVERWLPSASASVIFRP